MFRSSMLAAAVVMITALAGCGAGQLAQTSTEVSAIDGANSAGTGPVVIRDAQIAFGSRDEGSAVYQAGGIAPLQMWIINQGEQADRLLSAVSPAATSVSISGATALPPGGTIVATGQAPEAVPSGVPTATPVDQTQITLVGLGEAIHPGLNYHVTLTFEQAGPVTVALPVGPSPGPRPGD
jgi:periplasmic copper chaperone A